VHSSALFFAVSVLLFGVLCWRFRSRLTEFCLFCSVLLIPIAHASFMPQNVFGIPGVSLLNVILIVAVWSLLRDTGMHEAARHLPRYFSWSLVAFLSLFFVAVARTGLDIESLHPAKPALRPTVFRVVVLDGILAIKYVVVGYMVALYGIRYRSLAPASKALLVLPILLVPVTAFAFAIGIRDPGIERPLYDYARNAVGSYLSVHGNALGRTAVYLLLFALIAEGTPWRRLRGLSIACSAALIEMSLSRTAWVTAVLVLFVLFRRISGADRIWLAASVLAVTLALFPYLADRARYGWESAGGPPAIEEPEVLSTVNRVMAGRTGRIWPIVLPNFLAHPLVGQGFYSLWKPVHPDAERLVYNHPHNAYLEVALDMGLLGLAVLGWMLWDFWKVARRYAPFRYVLASCVIMSVTGGSFYPELQNAVIWVFLGMAVASALGAPSEDAQA